ncbi:uncharacterized protein LOC124926197 [Impatiens glandulifera]|uniref:uncharacterized protein LOC124926197 n=1 Tax=Impatiens glandulifera TaxID=253017 RepID=UPI001FB141B3|nr:uncharacterized protein LOC124926197 [Impatiens glandulifera]
MGWLLKKILKLRNNIAEVFDISWGDGRNTLFWHDPWYENQPLINKEEFRNVRIKHDYLNAKIRDIKNGLWNSLLRRILEKQQIVDLADLVWLSKVIPRHQFILWLAFKESLNTRYRVKKYMEIPNTSCLLCEENEETTDHLFSCPFALELWKKFAKSMKMASLHTEWKEIKKEAILKANGKNFMLSVFKTGFGTIVYHIWRERNARMHSRIRRSVDETWEDIVFDSSTNLQTLR